MRKKTGNKQGLGGKVRKLKAAGKSLLEISRILSISYEKLMYFEKNNERAKSGNKILPKKQYLNEIYEDFKKNPKSCSAYYQDFIKITERNELTSSEFLKCFLTYIQKREHTDYNFTDYKNYYTQQKKENEKKQVTC